MQNSTAQDGAAWLDQLRDIHAAPEPALWPPAPGWWLVGAVMIVLLIWLVLQAYRRWRARRRRLALLARLDGLSARHDPAIDPAGWLAAVNRLVKWVALRAFPGEAAGLEGQQWTGFLAMHLDADPADVGLAPLADGPYRPRPEFEPEAVRATARRWILAHG